MKSARLNAALIAVMTIATPALAFAGPCSDDIASIGKQLSTSSALGPVTTGTLSGSTAGTHQNGDTPAPGNKAGTSASNRVGGTAGTKEMNAATGGVATSDVDVRKQQAGNKMTTAETDTGKGVETAPNKQSSAVSADDHMARAKVAWQKAVDLNAQNNAGCKSAVAEARTALQGS